MLQGVIRLHDTVLEELGCGCQFAVARLRKIRLVTRKKEIIFGHTLWHATIMILCLGSFTTQVAAGSRRSKDRGLLSLTATSPRRLSLSVCCTTLFFDLRTWLV